MSIKLRDLIRNVRACKTGAEERAVIAKECALIRTAFKDKDNEYRHRNVAKLLYMHMLGYPTHFGQMESLKLIASPTFPEKRIGYLALMLLLDEKQKVLMLVTNSLKNDMASSNPYIVGLALCALGNICSPDMARDLSNEVEKFFRHPNAYIRKKAALCATRIVRKVPDLIEDYTESVPLLLTDKNHAVVLSGCTLMIEMISIDTKLAVTYRKHVPTLVRLLKSLVVAGFVSEYDVAGITDPFLQCRAIQLLRLLGTGNAEASEHMNDILAQIAINTEQTKNPGNAILYETVQTIMAIEAEPGLRVLAVNILGRFLSNRDNNIRYVALNTLCKTLTPSNSRDSRDSRETRDSRDTQAIQRHRNTIVDCLKDADISIRRRALDLIYALVSKSNVKALIKELLNYLSLTSGDAEFKQDLTEKICNIVAKFAPNKHWHIDTLISVLATAGNVTPEDVLSDLIQLISSSKTLHAYAVYKLYYTLYKKTKHAQLPLIHVVVWCIGEYGELLINEESLSEAKTHESSTETTATWSVVPPTQVLDLLQKIIKHPLGQAVTKQFVLTALIKLSARFPQYINQIREMISQFQSSINVELQQRSCEYVAITQQSNIQLRNSLLERMPIYTKKAKTDAEGNPLTNDRHDVDDEPDEGGDEEEEEEEESSDDSDSDSEEEEKSKKKKNNNKSKQNGTVTAASTPAATTQAKAASSDLFNLDLLSDVLGMSSTPTPAPTSSVSAPAVTTAKPAAPAAAPAAASSNSLDFLSDLLASPSPVQSTSVNPLALYGNAAPMMTSAPVASTSTSSLDLFGALSAPVTTPAPAVNASPFFMTPTPTPAPVVAPSSSSSSLSLFDTLSASPVTSSAEPAFPPAVVYENNGLRITFSYDRKASTPEVLRVTATFVNTTPYDFTNFDFQVAVLKHIQLQLDSASSNVVPANQNGSMTQSMTLTNTMHGQKKLVIRIKADYQVQGQPRSEQGQVSQFP